MAPPLIAAAVPIGAKILGLAKGLIGGGKAAAAVKSAAGVGPQLAGATKGAFLRRKAGDVLGSLAGAPARGAQGIKDLSSMKPDQMISYLKNLKTKDVMNAGYNMSDDAGLLDRVRRGIGSVDGFKKNLGVPMSKGELATMIAPDLLFGGIAAATTEGDIVDKAIAGAGAAGGGIIGGIGGRGLLGPKSNLGIIGTEMIGGMVGDQIGYGLANNVIRAKNGGMTPQEQLLTEQDEAYRAQLIAELQSSGLV